MYRGLRRRRSYRSEQIINPLSQKESNNHSIVTLFYFLGVKKEPRQEIPKPFDVRNIYLGSL